ncbi:unnamed protein product [Adineta ricciae]|uniref:Peptidase C1A papain C-terminal domain-containing protein n=1 Tax=Adineta ricciae TaxID=249248 RepID=A0A815T3C7_ADIRI|nr:unnamed protein product [Adineta ricciae]
MLDNRHVDVSRLFIYYNSRCIDGLDSVNMEDNGTRITSAIEALKKWGCCKEDTYPYNEKNKNTKPSQHCYDEGENYRIKKFMQIKVDLNEMKACLAESYPFVFGLRLFESFAQARDQYGRVPMPTLFPRNKDKMIGQHTMLAVGYNDDHSSDFPLNISNNLSENRNDRRVLSKVSANSSNVLLEERTEMNANTLFIPSSEMKTSKSKEYSSHFLCNEFIIYRETEESIKSRLR